MHSLVSLTIRLAGIRVDKSQTLVDLPHHKGRGLALVIGQMLCHVELAIHDTLQRGLDGIQKLTYAFVCLKGFVEDLITSVVNIDRNDIAGWKTYRDEYVDAGEASLGKCIKLFIECQ